jgi:uroporphyrinogen decarboxylase
MVSLSIVREFMLPYYKRIIDFLKAHGVKIILVDTDGDCNSLIPLFVEVGVTGMYPFEVHCGMDIVKVRQQYPTLQMCGGIPKSEITKGRAAIDKILEPVAEVIKTGGYIPFGDHFIPPDVPWEEFLYYRTRLNEIIDRCGKES